MREPVRPPPHANACDPGGGAGLREGGELEAPLDRLAAHRAGAKAGSLAPVVGEHHRQLRFRLEARIDEEAAAVGVARVVVDEDLAVDAPADQDALLVGEALPAEFVKLCGLGLDCRSAHRAPPWLVGGSREPSGSG